MRTHTQMQAQCACLARYMSCSYVSVFSVCVLLKWLLPWPRSDSLWPHREQQQEADTSPVYSLQKKEPRFLSELASLFIFLFRVLAPILDQPGLRLDRKCFMLVKIIALSFPTHKISFVIRWGMYLLRQSLSCQSDGNSFN